MIFILPYIGGKKEITIKMDEDQLQILDELPSSAVELQVKDKVPLMLRCFLASNKGADFFIPIHVTKSILSFFA